MFFIKRRIISEALYVINNNATVRETAKYFNISKSTVHKDLNERLNSIDSDLYKRIREIFDEHTKLRHIKGGEVTRKKYKLSRT